MYEWWGMWYVYRILLMGEGIAYGGLPFPGTGCPVPDTDYINLVLNY